MKKEYNNENGKYTLYLEKATSTMNVVISECKNKKGILQEINRVAEENQIYRIRGTDRSEVFFGNKKEDYQLNRYVVTNPRKIIKDYSHEIVNEENTFLYMRITNEATKNVDNMSFVTIDEVNEYKNKKNAVIGFIKYKEEIIGTFVIDGANLESFCIRKEFRGKKLALNALYYIMNLSSSEGIYLYCSSRNTVAMNLYKKAGFQLSIGVRTQKYYDMR